MKRQFTPDLILRHDAPFLVRTSESAFTAPETLDLRDLVLPTENQEDSPKCAAYTATSWLEAIMWRRTGKPRDYDPDELYAAAKHLDGMPEQPGTTLKAVLLAMVSLQWVDRSVFDIRVAIPDIPTLKRAIHRYGTALISLNIGQQWTSQYGKLEMPSSSSLKLGGHAVVCCGYNRDGVYIQNSWGKEWGRYGFAHLSWKCFNSELMEVGWYANVLDGIEG